MKKFWNMWQSTALLFLYCWEFSDIFSKFLCECHLLPFNTQTVFYFTSGMKKYVQSDYHYCNKTSLSQMMYIMVFSIQGFFTNPHMKPCSNVRSGVLGVQNIGAFFPGLHLGNLAFKACQTLWLKWNGDWSY